MRSRLHFHPVKINDYGLFKYPDYTLPLSVKMAEVSRDHGLDILHVHYAVPHATAAILARAMLPPDEQPRVVTTLHGTDTTLLGQDAGYAPAIRHALTCSDAVTTVSAFLQQAGDPAADRHGGPGRSTSFTTSSLAPRAAAARARRVRRELGLGDEVMVLHCSNLRPVKRIDLLLETVARIRPREAFKLVILAGESFGPFAGEVRRLGLEDRVIVRDKVDEIEDFMQAADVGLITSETESFCLSILEAMFFACPSVATRVGGIPEVIDSGETGVLVPYGDAAALARARRGCNPGSRAAGSHWGERAQQVVPASRLPPSSSCRSTKRLYRRICG